MTEERRVIIHIGPSKTGSSALQYQLSANQTVLKQQGVYYPSHGVDNNNISAGNLNSLYKKDAFNNFVFSKEKYDKLMSDFSQSNCKTLLLSSEFFFANLSTLSQYFPHAIYVGYIRNPLELVNSEYNQTVKRHGNYNLFKFTMTEFNVLKKIEANFSHLNMVLRPYLAGGNQAWDITVDFFEFLGLSLQAEKIQTNRSYAFEALELKRHLNYFPLNELNNRLDIILQQFDGQHGRYSILSNCDYERNKASLIEELNAFILRSNQSALLPLVDHITHSSNPEYKKQNSVKDFFALVNFIKQKDLSLFNDIQKVLIDNKNILCGGDIFQLILLAKKEPLSDAGNLYALFGIDLSHVNAALHRLSEGFDSIISNDNINDKADLTRELALVFEKENMHQYAKLMMALAGSFRPDGPAIHQKLEQYTQ